jgi:hypothetical protein
MKVALGWSLVALAILGSFAICTSAGSSQLVGYAMGGAYTWTILILVAAYFVRRREDADFKANVTLVTGVVVLLVFAWYTRTALEVAHEERETALARPESDRISQAAMQEIAAIAAGSREAPATSTWAPYANPSHPVALDDKAVPLSVRFAELTRRTRARDVEFARDAANAAAESDLTIAVDAVRLVDANQRQLALTHLQAYREIVQSMEPRLAQARAQYFEELTSLGLSKISEAQVREGFERAVAESLPVLQDKVRKTLAAIEKVEALVQLVDDHVKSVRVEGDDIAFSDAAAQSSFDNLREQLGVATP